jgi:dTDP-4-dehydrorhamnose reductase
LVRTSLIVGVDPDDRISAAVAADLQAGKAVTLFTDELRCPILVDDLARQLWEVAAVTRAERAGAWNLVGPEALSRFALGLLVARRHGIDSSGIVPALNRDLAAPRPRDLRLSTSRADAALRTRARPITEALFPL